MHIGAPAERHSANERHRANETQSKAKTQWKNESRGAKQSETERMGMQREQCKERDKESEEAYSEVE